MTDKTARNSDFNKEQATKRELKKLTKAFKDMPIKHKKVTEKLINQAAWLAASIEELQIYIDKHGYTEEYTGSASRSIQPDKDRGNNRSPSR